jgi:exodeoxyribonuclease V alpha subunit
MDQKPPDMTGEPGPTPPSELSGQIERITYSNPESGFTVARVKVYGHHDLVTVVGNLAAAAAGEVLQMKGHWSSHPQHGRQFNVINHRTRIPATVYGIRRYLGSGLIRNIGPKLAERIVARFGKETLQVIDGDVSRLTEIEGIGPKRVAQIRQAWAEQKEIRRVMLFLQEHGIGSGYAVKIFKKYGNDAVAVMQENPYRLAGDIFGIGFVTADKIAQQLGFDRQAAVRIQSGVLYVLQQLSDEGHVFFPYEFLVAKVTTILGVDQEPVRIALGTLALEKQIVIEDLGQELHEQAVNQKAVYLAKYHLCETHIARRLRRLLENPSGRGAIDADRALAWIQGRLKITLAHKQLDAVRAALTSKLMVITGGPGTGKTTIINAIIRIYARAGARIALAAPTGRAAKRMSEACGHPAKTLHRLLEFSPAEGGFRRNTARPLPADLIVVDEASMIDTILMHHLLKAVAAGGILILVGDVHQLPSVGAGNILGDIIAAKSIPVVALTEIFRQAKQSRIIVNAHRINSGRMPLWEPGDGSQREQDFFFIEQAEPERVVEIIVRLVSERISRRFGLHPVEDIQVLTPMHRGIAGAANLNRRLQEALNPTADGFVRGEQRLRAGDKVMQIRNNYDKEVFNGDIGRITAIDGTAQRALITFDGREVGYDFADLDEVVPAYAVSVHKSQGSEYPAVVIPILTQHYILLQRNLIYTAITRGRRLVILVGTRRALHIAINNNQTQKRYTRLAERLAESPIQKINFPPY